MSVYKLYIYWGRERGESRVKKTKTRSGESCVDVSDKLGLVLNTRKLDGRGREVW